MLPDDVDRYVVEGLFGSDDAPDSLFGEMIALWVGNLPGRLDAVRAATTPTEISSAVHALASASITLGLMRLGEAGRSIERDIRSTGRPADGSVQTLIDQAEAAGGRLTEWLGT